MKTLVVDTGLSTVVLVLVVDHTLIAIVPLDSRAIVIITVSIR
jgi:hypothetical protein